MADIPRAGPPQGGTPRPSDGRNPFSVSGRKVESIGPAVVKCRSAAPGPGAVSGLSGKMPSRRRTSCIIPGSAANRAGPGRVERVRSDAVGAEKERARCPRGRLRTEDLTPAAPPGYFAWCRPFSVRGSIMIRSPLRRPPRGCRLLIALTILGVGAASPCDACRSAVTAGRPPTAACCRPHRSRSSERPPGPDGPSPARTPWTCPSASVA